MCICIVVDTVWKELDIVRSYPTMILYPSEIELQKKFKPNAELYSRWESVHPAPPHSNLQWHSWRFLPHTFRQRQMNIASA